MAGVYISYPFCAQKCTYCNFASGVFPRELERSYRESLRAEIEAQQWQWQPETVYLGGGTPSQMEPEDLSPVLSSIAGGPWKEATLEAAPGGISAERAAAWARLGINRVSLGVQSFDQRELARTGRKHTSEVVAREIEILRSNGIRNFNVDLIAGLPGQTAASWRASLDWIDRLSPPHVSVYMLEVDEDSRLGNEVLLNGKRYGAPEVPGDDQIAEFYETAVEELARQGIERYEISNFARPGFESAHNLKYWRLEPYVGFGADAHSFDGSWRYQNMEQAEEYVREMSARGSARLERTAANLQEEKFFVGLRLAEGIRPAASEWNFYAKSIERFLAAGLLERRGEMLRLTNRGVLVSNEVFAEFLAA